MPRGSSFKALATNRALAVALERLAPIYRRRIIRAVATSMAQKSQQTAALATLLDADELVEASQLAAKMRAKLEAARITNAIAACLYRMRDVARRISSLSSRRVDKP